MTDLLDDYKNGDQPTDHLYVQDYQVEAIVEKLNEYNIPHRIRPSKNLDDTGFVPLTAETQLNRPDFVIQIPNNLHFQVDQLIEENPELLYVSKDVREIFLASTLDEEGWLEILVYPEDWEDGDKEIASKLLAQKGIQPTTEMLVTKKAELDLLKAKQKEGLSILQMFFITMILILLICVLLSGFDLF